MFLYNLVYDGSEFDISSRMMSLDPSLDCEWRFVHAESPQPESAPFHTLLTSSVGINGIILVPQGGC